MLELVRPDSPELWTAARMLVEEYASGLGVDLSFQNFHLELDELPLEYGPPDGCFLLARQAGMFAACGGVRRFDERNCELKRLYVVPTQRGGGVGRVVVEALIKDAQGRGYDGMLLDTLPTMKTAQKMYADLGFVRVPAYCHNPVPGTTYWRLRLNDE